ncbi:MAG: hypothetical protein A2015_13635 [Spirochaetes bacterium GWF1_31_7]|nr:MAG: hypothetical protein A2Y30_11190 [Spirochaetes bacterium GWE1_32_154]OHD47720.1 MAG: hypothetical protein A2Y29_05160 [Spirochaetes bacterium GWE2_31_10]OHD49861.1 MAG: hypothetical protein A2015_13635 [Spirochaetes bacterium GWF1_31_7]OHD82149.1 MAG: hypothetical protein A2355_13715 [Spirochaetes bacterium RIFOXYB1_FULL_32_8]HBD92890.1 hypothetical protein [Spirochaetia bacterium]
MSSLKTLSYVFKIIIVIFLLFIAVSVLIIYPVYKISDINPMLYNKIVIGLIVLYSLFLLSRGMIKLSEKYNSLLLALSHIITLNILPVLYLFTIIIIEAIFYRLSFIINFYIFLLLEVILQIVIIFVTLYLINIRNRVIKKYFNKREKKC